MQTKTATGAGGEQTDRLSPSADSHGDHIRDVLRGRKDSTDMGAPLNKSMSPEKQRIAIAEECGTNNPHWFCPKCLRQVPPEMVRYDETHHVCGAMVEWRDIKDYVNDLNATQEAWLSVPMSDCDLIHNLARIVGSDLSERTLVDIAKMVNSTAAQRAEAFLKTIGKWTEE